MKDQRDMMMRGKRGGAGKNGVDSFISKEISKQATGNHPGIKLDEVMKYPRSYQQLHEKEVLSRVARGGRLKIGFKGFARGMSPGIILLLVVLFINLLGSVQAKTDCEELNEWLPDHASSTGCCLQTGITCIDDRITKMYVFIS
jgi:Leucine-rich repeat (LRR) protein